MKGRPLVEIAFWLMLLVFGLLPLSQITRSPSAAPVQATETSEEQHAWVLLRSSHVPQRWSLWQDGHCLWEGGGSARADTDLVLKTREGSLQLALRGEWAESASGQIFVELTVEPEGQPALREGAWTTGQFDRSFSWELQGEQP